MPCTSWHLNIKSKSSSIWRFLTQGPIGILPSQKQAILHQYDSIWSEVCVVCERQLVSCEHHCIYGKVSYKYRIERFLWRHSIHNATRVWLRMKWCTSNCSQHIQIQDVHGLRIPWSEFVIHCAQRVGSSKSTIVCQLASTNWYGNSGHRYVLLPSCDRWWC